MLLDLMLMQRPKWLSGWGKGKNLLEGSLIIDVSDVKVVEVSFNSELVLFAVGTMSQSQTVVSGQGSAATSEKKDNVSFEWKIFYDSTVLPDFMSLDKAKDFMAGIVAVSSGTTSVYDAGTTYIASGNKPSKGNAPHLLDYEMAKKIEEARKKIG
jgi:hypothetical protein